MGRWGWRMGGALILLMGLGALWEGLHLLPPRYVARLVPEPLQAWIWPAHPAAVPTPSTPVPPERLAVLLTPLTPALRPSPGPTPYSDR
jgi:hypothetical protein